MAQKKEGKYHHGQLKNQLIEAAVKLVETDGWKTLSLRKVARSSGVSHMAPYHHFPDKMTLLAAVAEHGFEMLTSQIETANTSVQNHSLALREAAIIYILFAVRHPHLYRLMFSFDFGSKHDYPDLYLASSNAFLKIITRLSSLDADLLMDTNYLKEIATTAWALVHGLAMLQIDHKINEGLDDEEQIKATMGRMLDILWLGMAHLPSNR